MTIGRMIFFAVWLALAMLAGALIVFTWERLRSKFSAGGAPAKPDLSGEAKRQRDS